jgi:hypothetical protein
MSYQAFSVTSVTLFGKDGNADRTVSGAEAGPVYEAYLASQNKNNPQMFILSSNEVIKFDCYCDAERIIESETIDPDCDPIPCESDEG